MIYLVYLLMFLTSLATALYAAALGVKLAARLRNPLSRPFLALTMPVAAMLPGAVVSILAQNVCDPYLMSYCDPGSGGITLGWLYKAAIGWTAVAALGGVVILVAGFQNKGWKPASSEWHAEGLFFRAVIALVLTVALVIAADTLVNSRMKKDLTMYLKLRDWAEPAPTVGTEEGRNAYTLAYSAVNSVSADLPEWWELSFTKGHEFDATSPEARALVWKYRDAYALITNAASISGAAISEDDLNAPERGTAFAMARMLSLSARVNAGRGWFISAMRDIRSMLGLEMHYRHTRGLAGNIQSVALRELALDTLEQVVAMGGFYSIDPRLYPDLDSMSGPLEYKRQMRIHYAGDMVKKLGELTDRPKGAESGNTLKFKKTVYRVAMADHALCCLESEFEVQEKAFDAGAAAILSLDRDRGDCAGYLGNYVDEYIRVARAISRSRGADLAFAAVKFYRNRGRYPSEIAELVPGFLDAIPADPFGDGGSMVMEDQGLALLFYSPAYKGQDTREAGFFLKKK